MGRKTFESFGAKPLPGRTNIIITHDKQYQAEGAVVVHHIDDALQAAGDAEEIMIIGGASFYEQMLPRANRFYLTLVHGQFEADAWFPAFDESEWQVIERHDHDADEKSPCDYSFLVKERIV